MVFSSHTKILSLKKCLLFLSLQEQFPFVTLNLFKFRQNYTKLKRNKLKSTLCFLFFFYFILFQNTDIAFRNRRNSWDRATTL